MEAITVTELSEIIKIHKSTVRSFLCNYRFNKYQTFNLKRKGVRFILNREFLNDFYNYLLCKNKFRAAIYLQQNFPDYEIEEMEYGEFLCKN